MNADDLRSLWSKDSPEPLSAEELLACIREARGAERRDTAGGAVATIGIALLFAASMLVPHLRLPFVVLAAVALWTLLARAFWGALPEIDPALPASEQAAAWRLALLRSARWLSLAPLWCVAPLAAGMLFVLSRAEHPERVDLVLVFGLSLLGSLAHLRAANERRRLADRLEQIAR